MTRLCVIGNSHLAALKLGWDELARDGAAPALAPTFFGAPRDGMRHVRLEDGAIVPARDGVAEHFARMSGGQGAIRLADYDAVLLVGLNVSIKRILRLYRTHAWHGLAGAEGKTLVPRAFVHDFLTERYASTLLAETAALVRGAFDLPVVALAEPFWAPSARGALDGKPDYGWDAAIAAGDGPELGETFRRTVAAALAPFALFVPQPPETVEDGILTRAAFNRDASRLISGEGGGTDAAHMNGAFGRRLWPLVAKAVAPRAPRLRATA